MKLLILVMLLNAVLVVITLNNHLQLNDIQLELCLTRAHQIEGKCDFIDGKPVVIPNKKW